MNRQLPDSVAGIMQSLALTCNGDDYTRVKQILNEVETLLLREEVDPVHYNRPAYIFFCTLYQKGIYGQAIVELYNQCHGDILAMRIALGLDTWQLIAV